MQLTFKHKHVLWAGLFILLQSSGESLAQNPPGFSFTEDSTGVELWENDRPVFFYRKLPLSPDGKHYYCNYLHPLYSLQGDTLTELFPADHPHHRGIFWAWHQLYARETNLGDGWMMDGISQVVDTLWTCPGPVQAELNALVYWYSDRLPADRPFLKEKLQIITARTDEGSRTMDFRITLEALVEEFRIGGSDDEKGYGGFSARIRMPEDLKFISENDRVIPQNLQIRAGDRMEFSGSFSAKSAKSSITLICDPETPNYPAPWILRQQNSMQNVVWPGRIPVSLKQGEPVVLKYSLVIK